METVLIIVGILFTMLLIAIFLSQKDTEKKMKVKKDLFRSAIEKEKEQCGFISDFEYKNEFVTSVVTKKFIFLNDGRYLVFDSRDIVDIKPVCKSSSSERIF